MATVTKATVIKPGTNENEVNFDFRGLTPRGGGKAAHVPEGDYLLQVVQAKNVTIGKTSRRQISVQSKIVGTPDNADARKGMGDTVYTNLQIEPDSKGLWFSRNFIEDLTGKEVTGKAGKLTLEDKAGLLVGATLVDGNPFDKVNKDSGEVTTTVRSEVKYTFPATRFIGVGGSAGESSNEDDEEAPAPKARNNGRASAAQAAEAVTESSDEDEEEDIPIQELESI